MSLYDHRQQASWLSDGWHDVRVTGVRMFSAHTGTEGLEVAVQRQDGAEGSVSFYLTEKGMKRLAWFAEACGLTERDMRAYEPLNPSSHQVLVNRRVRVLSQRPTDKKYHEIAAWEPAGSDSKPANAPPRNNPQPPTQPPEGDDGEPIPF